MASYDTLTISSQSAPVNTLHLSSFDSNNNNMADTFTHNLDFPGETLFSDIQTDLSSIPFTPSYELDSFSTTFEDPLSYQSGLFDNFLDENLQNSESLPIDLDNKLLGFGAPIHKSPLLDENGQTWPRMTAELNGMFCVAEDVFEGDSAGRPLELTCYRRNLFQISGNINLSRTAAHVLIDGCRRAPIYDLTATLSATESIEGKPTEIISVPWKSGSANGTNNTTTEDKTGTAPASIPIDLNSNQETDPVQVSIPIAWGRLQFKYATANNGRRKGLQQHYQIQIALTARLQEDGQVIKLAEIQSNPIVVRGRSPKNFDSSKDVPLNDRKSEAAIRARQAALAGNAQWIEPALSQGSNRYYAQRIHQQPMDQMAIPPQQTPLHINTETRPKKPSLASPKTQKRRPPVPQPQWKSEPQEHDDIQQAKPPTGLSLVDEDSPQGSSEGSLPSSSKRTNRTTVTSPLETADLLYEYFPLSLDDWMPPVDAIYRPHVVHHLRVQLEGNGPQQIRAKPKRYFSAEEE